MKSLDSLLHSLRLQSAIQNRVVLGEPWGVKFPARKKTGKFHFMELGGGILNVSGESPVQLEQGDLALVFCDSGHAMQDLQQSEPTPLAELLEKSEIICTSGLTLRFGGNGQETSVITGDFLFDETETHPLWRMLPPYVLLKGQNGQAAELLDTTLKLLSREAMEARPGALEVLNRLCDVLFIQAIRGWVKQNDSNKGWAAAVQDSAIDEALDLMQRLPAEPWTVEKLARQVALSRSTFAEKFHRLTGDTPMNYLAQWRMHLAAQLLSDSQESVAMIAGRVGYESEAAFAKAFKRRMKISPGAYRRAR